jgi:hypothetical protein
VEVTVRDKLGVIPRPDLLGAILLKARAVDVDDQPGSQRIDLLFLLSLVTDARAMKKQLRGGERRWLAKRSEIFASAERTYGPLSKDRVEDARFVLGILTQT